MQGQLQARLQVLKAEWAAGHVKLRELELQQLRLRELLLRLRGAIQVLEDLLGQAKAETPAPGKGFIQPLARALSGSGRGHGFGRDSRGRRFFWHNRLGP
jgi:hypothetical protein